MKATDERRAGVVVCNWRSTLKRARLVTVGFALAAPALAMAASAQFNIPAEPLPAALHAFAAQSHMQLRYPYDEVKRIRGHAVVGKFASRAALARVLRDTGLKVLYSSNSAATITRAAADSPRVDTALEVDASVRRPADPATTAPSKLQEVVVTGSRIARRADYTSPSPLVTVNAAAFRNRADVGVENALNELPQFRVSGNASTLSPAFSPFPSATSAPGAATVDLRGLGINRTLVLIDGRRAQPVNALLAVDLNTIPAAAIESVQVITGGAASTYGADAIAGVVNFRLRSNFQGAEVDGQYGISQYGDDKTSQFDVLLGGNFENGKGNMMLVLNESQSGAAPGINRPWVRAGWNDPGTPGGTLDTSPLSAFVPNPANMPVGAAAFPLLGSAYWIDQNGNIFDQLDPLNPAHPYTGPLGGASGFKLNPAGGGLGYNDQLGVQETIPLKRWNALVSGHYHFNDHLSAFVLTMFSKTHTQAVGTSSGLYSIWSVTVPYSPLYDNPSSAQFGKGPAGTTYHPVPAGLAAILNERANPSAPWEYNGGLDYIGGFETDTTSNIYQITLGLDGDVPGTDWTWSVYGQRGESNITAEQPNGFPSLQRIQDLFNANEYGKGFKNTYPIAVAGQCTSGLPIFNPNGSVNNAQTISPDCADWILLKMNSVTKLVQDVYEGDIQGGLLEMPLHAGRLRYAFGADYREEDFSFNPDSGYNANQSYPEVVQNIALPVGVQGTTTASEVYGELSIPILKDLPAVQHLEVDPGFRFSHYGESKPGLSGPGNNVNTWKLLGQWTVKPWVRFRGGVEVANRAPNVAELFTPVGGSQLTGINGVPTPDPCAVYPGTTPTWGNAASNPHRYNVQLLCQYLITRDGGPASIMVPGGSANNYKYDVFGYSPTPFPYSIAITQGNPNLNSESARTVTAGVVLSSPFSNPLWKRLRMSVDWYSIKVDGAIGIPGFNTVYQECLDAQYNSLVGAPAGSVTGAQMAANNPYCALINREYAPSAGDYYGAPRNYKAEYINQGGIKDQGIDFELDWVGLFADMGPLRVIPGQVSLNVVATYLDLYAVSPFPGAAYIDYTGTLENSSYGYKVLTNFTYSVNRLSVGLRWEHLPGVNAPPGSPPTELGANAYNLVGLFSNWQINHIFDVRFGIDNLFNSRPQWVGATPDNHAVGTTNDNYDTIGRRFYVGVQAKF